jgi:hypothetical protein
VKPESIAPVAWQAVYQAGTDLTYSIEDTECKECPVSFITPESFQFVQLITDAQHVHKATGAVSFDSNAGNWPSRLYDAAKVIAIEELRISNALHRAIEQRRGAR